MATLSPASRRKLDLEEQRLRALFLAGLAGDADAYRKFLDGMAAVLRRYLSRKFRRSKDADFDVEDAVQEALIAIHFRRHTFEPTLSLTAWSYAIAKYKFIDLLRSNSAGPMSSIEDFETSFDSREAMDNSIDLQNGLATLPDSVRDPIVMMKLEGRTADEISKKTGLNDSTVRTNIHRGLKSLAKFWKAERDK